MVPIFSFYFQIKWLSRPNKHFQPISLQTQLSLQQNYLDKNGMGLKKWRQET